MNCPRCEGTRIVKNGRILNGKPKWKCKDCGRQFVEHSEQRLISEETKELVDKLLLERLSLAGIGRVTGVSARWLQYYVNKKYENQPRTVITAEKKRDA